MTVLIASCIRQKPEILREFLESLDKLVKPEHEYFFILSDLEDKSKELFDSWSQGKTVETLTMDFNLPYVTDEDTHHWNTELVSNVMEMKNVVLERAREYDHLLFVDSDTYLHPDTLNQLLSRKKDIITEISWTKWYADDTRVLPSAWFYQKYGFPPGGLQQLRNKSLVKVGGFGGLYLISKKALAAGVSFNRIEGLDPQWGEDRHFAVRAQILGLELWCDTTMPSFHIYRMTDLPQLKRWKSNGFLTLSVLAQQSELMKKEWNQRALTRPYHYISDFREKWNDETFYEWGEIQTKAVIDKFLMRLKIDPSDLVILEIGCGLGRMTRALASRFKFVYAYDVSDQYIQMAKKINSDLQNAVFYMNDGLSFPEISDESVDFCFSGWTMQHMPSEEVIIKNIEEISRVLKDGGLYKIDPVLENGSYTFEPVKPSIKTVQKKSGPILPDKLKATSTYAWGATSTLKKMSTVLSNNKLTIKNLMENDGTEEFNEEFIGRNLLKSWLWGIKGKSEKHEREDVKKVLISVPHTGVLRAELVAYLLNVMTRNAGNKRFRISVDLSWGMPVDSNRNSIAKKLLGTDNEWLLTIDSDIEPPPMVLEELLSHGKKVVSAVCWSSMGGEEGGRWESFGIPYPVIMSKNPKGGWNVDREAASSEGRLVECDSGSTACLLLHREVLEAIEPPWFRLQYDEDGLCNAGEDFTFFDKVKARGYGVYVDLALQCGHYKTVDIKRLNELLAETGRKINV